MSALKYTEGSSNSWKTIPENYLNPGNAKFILKFLEEKTLGE